MELVNNLGLTLLIGLPITYCLVSVILTDEDSILQRLQSVR